MQNYSLPKYSMKLNTSKTLNYVMEQSYEHLFNKNILYNICRYVF